MHSKQDPIINNWYTNLTGKLFKVRMALYGDEGVVSLVIEYIDGTKQIITRKEWDCLKLMKDNRERQSVYVNSEQKQDKKLSKTEEELTH